MTVQFKFEPVGGDDVVRELEEIQAALGGTRDELDRTGDSSEGAADKLDAFTVNVAAGIAVAKEIGSALREVAGTLVDVAREWERQAGILNRFNGDVSEATKRTNGLLTQLDLMNASNKATQAGLKLTSHEFANLTVAASEYAAATGTDGVQAVDALTNAIAKGQAEALASIGIDLQGVTDLEDKQAEALRQLEEKYGDAESSADTLGGQLGVLENKIADTKTEFFRALGAAGDFNDEIEDLERSVKDLARAFDIFGISDGPLSMVETFAIGVNAAIRTSLQTIGAIGKGALALMNGDWRGAMDAAKDLSVGGQMENFIQNMGAGVRSTAGARAQDAARDVLGNRGGGGGGSRRGGGGGGGSDQFRPDMTFSMDEATLSDDFLLGKEDTQGFNSAVSGAASSTSAPQPSVDALIAGEENRLRLLEESRNFREEENDLLDEQNEKYETMRSSLESIGQSALQIGVAMSKGGNFKKVFAEWAKGFALQQGGAAIGEFAAALASAATQDYAGASTHAAAGAMHLAAAAAVGALGAAAGGGARAAQRGGQGATSGGGGGARPETPSGSRPGGGEGGPKQVVINFNSPMPEQEIGRAQSRAAVEATRRFGERDAA